MAGFVISAGDVAEVQGADGTTRVRLTIGPEQGCPTLVQRVLRFRPGTSEPQKVGAGEQTVLYVVSGTGTLHVDGEEEELSPWTGAYVAAGEEFRVENPGPEDVVAVAVQAPQERSVRATARRTVRWTDRPSLPASPNREFRYLVDHDVGCHDVTQFVGVIPPGRAPLHSHTYDEVIYVITGEGILHVDGRRDPIAAGSCIHLPPLLEHSLENTSEREMHVLGVFHPAGDPASRAGGTASPEEPARHN